MVFTTDLSCQTPGSSELVHFEPSCPCFPVAMRKHFSSVAGKCFLVNQCACPLYHIPTNTGCFQTLWKNLETAICNCSWLLFLSSLATNTLHVVGQAVSLTNTAHSGDNLLHLATDSHAPCLPQHELSPDRREFERQ